MIRHELFVALAQPYTDDRLVAAEIYRVGVRTTLRHRLGAGLVVIVVAAVTGFWWLLWRPVFGVILLLAAGVLMVVRWLQGRPNIVLIGIGAREVVVLRARFGWKWRVVNEGGKWPRGRVLAQPGGDTLAFELAVPGGELLSLSPIAVTADAADIAAALGAATDG